jgi:hypothetical protein
MLYILLLIVLALFAFMLLRIRIRFEFSKDSSLLFVGLGRSGPELDLRRKTGVVKLFNVRLIRFEIAKDKKRKLPKVGKKKQKPQKTAPKKIRKRSPRDIINVARKSIKPLWTYTINLLKTVAVEELEGRVEAGFEQPHLTGALFGYYQAALAAVPSVVEKVQYVPDWTGASFRGSCKVAMALPLYELLGRTAVLVIRLPLRDIIKLAIGKKKKGESDVQQRRRDTQGRGQ